LIVDATDVGIAAGGIGNTAERAACHIDGNVIRQKNRHVFSGIGVSFFCGGLGIWIDKDNEDSTFSGNQIFGENLMDFGIHAGKHPWDETVYADGGLIGHLSDPPKGNKISKASINLNIDGWLNGKLGKNQLISPSNVPIILANYDCCGGVAYGKNFTIADYADNNGAGTLDYSAQGTPDLDLVLHVISTSPSPCSPSSCGSQNTCSNCQNPAQDNCACRNTDGSCKPCPVNQQSVCQLDAKEL
jgi:hypothetical protein